jgi:LL-diaminopimelate aminotransferase
MIDYYMTNAKLIKQELTSVGFECFGGDNAPYLWVKTPNNLTSWQFFDDLLARAGVVCTPGSGFGSQGEGYFRLSSFAIRENVIKALTKIKQVYGK